MISLFFYLQPLERRCSLTRGVRDNYCLIQVVSELLLLCSLYLDVMKNGVKRDR